MLKPIHLYRPQRTQPEHLEAISVGREPVIGEILERLRRWQPGATRQHDLLIGPRGIGKTHILRLIEHRVRQTPDLQKKWHPISLPEDTYRLTKISDLLIEALHILAEESGDTDIINVYNQIKHDDDEARTIDLALDAFRRFHASHGCGILLMVENVNRLFERQIRGKAEIHRLRKTLIEEDWLTMICTSPTYLNAVTQPEEPLFEFFRIKLLSELTRNEQEQMLRRMAALDENDDFEDYLRRFLSRLQALYHFTGGNPRLTVMLYQLVANQAVTDVKTELDLLLDQLTPFYQDRMRDLAGQEGKLLEIMSLMPEGCTPSELAQEARMAGDLVRALITRLERSGYVRRETRRLKRTVYIIPERFFRIWHQMNHSRAARGRVQYLLEFFSSWYATKEERDQIWGELTDEFQLGSQEGDKDRIQDIAEYMEYVAAVSEGDEKLGREFARLRTIAGHSGPDSITQELIRLDREYGESEGYFLQKGYFLANDLEIHEAALEAFQKASEFDPNDVAVIFNQAVALDRLSQKDKARQIYQKVRALISKGKEEKMVDGTRNTLLKILREDNDHRIVYMTAYLFGRLGDIDVANDIISILQSTNSDWRRQYCATALGLLRAQVAVPVLLECLQNNDARSSAATALGYIGSKKAVKPLIECLTDENSITRGSAATALGRIGSPKAIESLLNCIKDEASNVRSSAAKALGRIDSPKTIEPLISYLKDEVYFVRRQAVRALTRIASEKKIPDLSPVMAALLEKVINEPREKIIYVVQTLLRSAFRSGDIEVIHHTLDAVRTHLSDAEALCAPYSVALDYLQSNRDPAIMERQHPEMREAVQLLVDAFDECHAQAHGPSST